MLCTDLDQWLQNPVRPHMEFHGTHQRLVHKSLLNIITDFHRFTAVSTSVRFSHASIVGVPALLVFCRVLQSTASGCQSNHHQPMGLARVGAGMQGRCSQP